MSRLILDSKAEASLWSKDDAIPAAPNALSLPRTPGERGEVIGLMSKEGIILLSLAGTGIEYDPVSPADPEFDRERDAFLAIPKANLMRYAEEFVLSKNGQVVDHDSDLAALTRRSVDRFGEAPVYITKVGGDFEISIDTPFLA